MVQFVLFFRIFCFVFQDCFKGGVSIFMRIFMKYEIHWNVWNSKYIEEKNGVALDTNTFQSPMMKIPGK